MPYSKVGVGMPVYGFNMTLNPNVPASVVQGNLLLLATGEYIGSDATPQVSGYTLLYTGTRNLKALAIFGRLATGTSNLTDSAGHAVVDSGGHGITTLPALSDVPSVTWPSGSNAWAGIVAYSGNPISLNGIVHAYSEQFNTNLNNLVYAATTITVNGCLVVALGERNKTSATNSGSYAAFGSFGIEFQLSPAGTSFACVYNDWIQNAATNIPVSTQLWGTGDGTQNYATIILALLPGSSSSPQLLANTGMFSVTGGVPTFNVGGTVQNNYLFASPGVFDYQGGAANSSVEIDPDAGVYSVSGPDALFNTSSPPTIYQMLGATGVFRVNGQAASFLVPFGVPNVVGMYVYDAQLALLAAGLMIAAPMLVDSPAVPGTVIGQSVAPGTPILAQMQVVLTVTAQLSELPPVIA